VGSIHASKRLYTHRKGFIFLPKAQFDAQSLRLLLLAVGTRTHFSALFFFSEPGDHPTL
jgi:hypothetical protein